MKPDAPPPPARRPACPNFSSGPCAKRPGWSLDALSGALLGRSHRAAAPRARLRAVIDQSRALLGLPADWRLGIVPGSDTGAVEMALWNLLGPRPVDVLAFEGFSAAWAADIVEELRLPGARVLRAGYGELPDLGAVDPAHDVVFAWNGTTSGVRMPDADWLSPPGSSRGPHPGPHSGPPLGRAGRAGRAGLAICDATSAAFAMDLPWDRLDVVSWSWQKCLGGEAAHGMLALSPRAAERLATHTPAWPLPKLFRLTTRSGLIEGIFTGDTINTPSLLCVEDALDGLGWAREIGGLKALRARSEANLAAVAAWVARTPYARFLARDPATLSPTAICLTLANPEAARAIPARLAELGVAHDIAPYRDAPPGLRLWGGPTVETTDIAALLDWIDWAYRSHADA